MINSSSLMKGKRGVIMGVASDRSIAWGIARTIANHGGQIALTYQNDICRAPAGALQISITDSRLYV